MKRRRVELLVFIRLCVHFFMLASANVVLIGNNATISFDDVEANFAPAVKGTGQCGLLYVADPLDACSSLTNNVSSFFNVTSAFVLIIRGGCSFEEKVRSAQKAGFQAAIVYDYDDGVLVAMAGTAAGIKINAVFIAKRSGEILKKYAGFSNYELWIIPSFENTAWSIMSISFISLLAMSAVLATCFFVRRHRIRREQPRASRVQEFHGMSNRLVKAMPSLIFTSVLEDNCTSVTCAICLEDYSVGEKLRILPCRHKFHAVCVDSWLTSWRTFCPVCKRDARTSTGDPPASESTPLLSSSLASMSTSSVLSSFRSVASSAIQIAPVLSQSPLVSLAPSISSTLYNHQIQSSYYQSPFLTVSRSSADLRNFSSPKSRTSYMASPHSLGYPSMSPLNSRYMSAYPPSPSNASPSLASSSGYQSRPLHYSESAASLTPFASTHSLPDC